MYMRQQSSKTGNVSNNAKTDYRLKNYRIRVVNLYVYAKLLNIMQLKTNWQTNRKKFWEFTSLFNYTTNGIFKFYYYFFVFQMFVSKEWCVVL
jgi:hypothetical protein